LVTRYKGNSNLGMVLDKVGQGSTGMRKRQVRSSIKSATEGKKETMARLAKSGRPQNKKNGSSYGRAREKENTVHHQPETVKYATVGSPSV